MNFPKTLIIGLGGLGSDIVVDVYKRFNKHAQLQEDKDKVHFITLDTDSNEIYERRKILKPEDVIQTSSTSNVTAGRFIDDIREFSNVEQWFPVEANELLRMTINDGAGQIRTISRLAFSHAIQNGKLDRLKQVLDFLLNVNVGEGNIIDVHIVTSLAGGTGAGSFLQVSYLVREYLSNNGIHDPKVLGYFMLGDILLHDPSINLSDPTKTTSILANTYASIKELNGIYTIEEGMKIPFEYGRLGSGFHIDTLNSIPFTQCFLYDFENNTGNNLRDLKNYKKQMEEFLYLNAFSPTGKDTRSQTINAIFQRIQAGEDARYGSTGISKIVYPVDNLLEYFANLRLYDNLKTTWLKIDKDFDDKYDEYIKNLNKGITTKEPQRGEFFISNVESLANTGLGVEQAIFKNILTSTQLIDEESNKIIGYKTEYLIQNIQQYLERLNENDKEISVLANLPSSESFLKEDDEGNDKNYIQNIEDNLIALKSEVFSFIEDNKRLALEEIFIKDIESPKYYNAQAKHRINSYVLTKGKAMHPIAQRYFYYQLLQKLELYYNDLVNNNKAKLQSIENYNTAYDLNEEQGGNDIYIENAIDAYNIYTKESQKLINLFAKIVGSGTALKDFKETFVSKSRKQSMYLSEYAVDGLKEKVFEGLIYQVKKIIDNLENLFNIIPDVMKGLENKYKALEILTAKNTSSIVYVLGKPRHRDYLYKEVIAAKDTIFFPENMSRSIYEEIYRKTYEQIVSPVYNNNNNSENKIKDILEEKVVEKQIKSFAETFKDDFAGYNIIQAMKKQAELDNNTSLNQDKILEFMKGFFREAERKATPYGARYDAHATKINTWAFHPECVNIQFLNSPDADSVFDNVGKAQDKANRVISDYFERTEIIREESVMVLKVPDNYPKFAARDLTQKYSSSIEGVYYRYYKKRIKETQDNPNLPTPHLDKRWGNPRLFRDLGISGDVYSRKILRAFIWGLSLGYIIPFDKDGTKIWAYSSKNQYGLIPFKDFDNRPLRLSVKNLLSVGLLNNPKIVDEINEEIDKAIDNAANFWLKILVKGGSIYSIDIIKKLKNYRFTEFEEFKNKNIISVFNGYITDDDTKSVSYIIEDIINTILKITGNKGENTKKYITNLMNLLIKNIPESTTINKDLVNRLFEAQLKKVFNSR